MTRPTSPEEGIREERVGELVETLYRCSASEILDALRRIGYDNARLERSAIETASLNPDPPPEED